MTEERPRLDLEALAPGLEATCRAFAHQHRSRIAQQLFDGADGLHAAGENARAFDGLLGALFASAEAALRVAGTRFDGRVALVAVGGLGRRELGLFSDVDVIVLADEPRSEGVGQLAEALLYPLWNVGIDVGHAVRGVEELGDLAALDLRTATMLVDARRIAGSGAIVDELRDRAVAVLARSSAALLDGMERDRRERHARFSTARSLVEPDVKNARGGLRDLDTIHWVLRFRWEIGTLAEAETRGVLLAHERARIERAGAFLWQVRQGLHRRASRRHDRLLFDDQRALADELGARLGVSSLDALMTRFHASARDVAELADRLFVRARVTSCVDVGSVEREPVSALTAFRRAEAEGLPLNDAMRDAVVRASEDAAWCERVRTASEAGGVLLSLLGAGTNTASELDRLGLLAALVPELARTRGVVRTDSTTVNPLDAHLVATADEVQAIRAGSRDDRPVLAAVARKLERAELVALAGLLHDLGGPEDSATARSVAARLGLSSTDAETVAWLVEEHGRFHAWALRRDTSQQGALASFLRPIVTLERLRQVYVLTYAHLTATSPDALSSWTMQRLDELYVAAAAALDGRSEASARAAVDRVLASSGDVRAFFDSMPARYAYAVHPDAVVAHHQIARSRRGLCVVAASGERSESTELVVAAEDRPGLLADIAAVLAGNRFTVSTANVFMRREQSLREAFGTFVVRHASGEPPSDKLLARVQSELESLLSGEVSVQALLERIVGVPSWARGGPRIATEIRVDQAVSDSFTVFDVFARDRPGLLHAIARTLHRAGFSIGVAKVATEGDRASDAFYVTDSRERKLNDDVVIERVRVELGASIDALASR